MSTATLSPYHLDELVNTQDHLVDSWHDSDFVDSSDPFTSAVLNNHRHNYLLWYQEDKARRDDMGFEYVYHAKRAIDQHNQQRNNFMEQIDLCLAEELHIDPQSSLPSHSETPGMMIDRLSILSLKIYHMALQLERDDVDETHVQTCANKLAILKIQRDDLKQCLQTLFDDIQNNQKTFKLYKQMKMYNDKSLNPQLYTNKTT